MSESSVVQLASVRPVPVKSSDWSARELLCSLINEPMPSGALVAWIDEHGLVQVRRAQLTAGQELDILRTAKTILFNQD